MTAYNFTTKLQALNYTIEIDDAADYGYFEHNLAGDGGGLWFEKLANGKLSLVDYDGSADLPKRVAATLRENGYIVDEEFN